MQDDSNADGMVEVVIATAGRPEFLAVALQSVVDQKLPDRIRRVVVSENGSDRRSESVARAFDDRLPIDYRFKSPCLPPLEHLSVLFEEATSSYVAFLCDDDWWLGGFLSRTLDGLERRGDCQSAFSASYWCKNEHDKDGFRYLPLALQCVLGKASFPVSLSSDQVHAAAWIVTPFHFSTMVARRDALRAAASKLRSFDAFNIDRLLELFLSVEGKILFFEECGAGIRQHSSNWSVVEKREISLRSDRQAVRFAKISAEAFGTNVDKFWSNQLGTLSLGEKRQILRSLAMVYSWDELREMGLIRSAGGTGAVGFCREMVLKYGGKISQATPELLRKGIKRLL